jgi:hypothetical protein
VKHLLEFILALMATVRVFFRSRCHTALEILALRQQVAVLNWTTLRRVWPRWADVLIVKPETVVGWHRTGFRLFGSGDRGPVVADRRLLLKSALSFAAWLKTIRVGALPRFTANSRSWASSFANEA